MNRATINGLVDAFEEDSALWQDQILTAKTETVLVSGKRATVVYLVAQNYELTEDDNGYVVIVKKGTQVASSEPMPSFEL